MKRRIALRNLRGVAAPINERRGPRRIRLQRVVKRHVLLPRPGVFKKSELPRHLPLDAGNCHSHGAVNPEMIEAAMLQVHKSSRDMLVRVVTPRRGIRSGAGKKTKSGFPSELPAKVAAINGAQAWRPGQK